MIMMTLMIMTRIRQTIMKVKKEDKDLINLQHVLGPCSCAGQDDDDVDDEDVVDDDDDDYDDSKDNWDAGEGVSC